MRYQTHFKPTKYHLDHIEKWLTEEMKIYGEGFYNNWKQIKSSYEENKCIILTENDYAIGFLTYNINELIIKIEIANIKQNYKNKGLGRKLINETLNEFQKKGLLICELFCAPGSSEPIWRNFGFQNFPDFPNNQGIRMFMPLVPANDTSKTNKERDIILLWNSESHIAQNIAPKWTWSLIYKENSNELVKPIIYPAYKDWLLCWKKENEIKYKGKVKKFDHERIEFGDFIIITSLRK